MDSTQDLWIKKVYAVPALRQIILNKGTLFLYCDYSGFTAQNNHGVACCLVYNRMISVTGKNLLIEKDEGSNYGELLAIAYSLDILTQALTEQQPKQAIIYSDCSRIEQILSKDNSFNEAYKQIIDEIRASLQNLKLLFPSADVKIRYMRKHKNNNSFHRLAHNAAREAALDKVN